MKPTRREASPPQLNPASLDEGSGAAPDDPSQSGVRWVVNPASVPVAPAAAREKPSDVTVVFRGVLPMERLVQLIRRRAHETAPAAPLVVEVEQLQDIPRWRVRVHSDLGEFCASEAGPFLAVTRAFALLA